MADQRIIPDSKFLFLSDLKHNQGLSENNLIRILRTLSKDEWKEFEKFVASPYFNRGRNHIQLLNALHEFYPSFDKEVLTKESLYAKLFPGKSYKDSVMKSMLSRLDEMAEEFLIHAAFRKNEHLLRERLLIKETSERGLQKTAFAVISRTGKLLSSKKRGLLDHLTMRDYMNEVSNYNYIFDESHKGKNDLISYQTNILYAFLTEFLITEGTLYSQKTFWDESIQSNFILQITDIIGVDNLLEQIRIHDPENYDVLNLFNLLRLATRHSEDDEYYYRLRDEFFAKVGKYDLDFRKFMMHCLSSVLTVKGKAVALKDAHNLRKKIYEENLYLFSQQRKITVGEFRAAFLEAVYLQELDWAEQFYNQYIDFVQPSLRAGLSFFCRAQLLFNKGDYDGALESINNVRINQMAFKFDTRVLTSQIYYNTGSYENLFSYLDSYAKLLENSRSQKHSLVESHSRFVKFLRRLVKLRLQSKDDAEIAALKEKIKNDRVVMKQWLLDRVEELRMEWTKK